MYNFGHRTKKCIHPDARCDLHPHHACMYKDQKGEFVKNNVKRQKEYEKLILFQVKDGN